MVHETKFLISLEKAPAILDWARKHMDGDPHGNGEHRDEYLVQSLYLDTAEWHVFRKIGSYGRAKFRIRRYSDENWLFLERKMKRAGVVRKKRTTIGLEELPGFKNHINGFWYDRRLTLRQLKPMCYIQYHRVARQKMTSDGMLRLTLDRSLEFNTNVTAWSWPNRGGEPVLNDKAILELKYPNELALPSLAKQIIAEFNLNPAAASKYRMAIRASQYAPQVMALTPELNSEEEPPVLRIA
ncbi:MAG TPA: polyphosphate polymerase domain-containing protein [Verrucomicrobiae bacterium]|nr:polyphosphate polymerase domain-containing protein [Verrucomicrobiae bacterium]